MRNIPCCGTTTGDLFIRSFFPRSLYILLCCAALLGCNGAGSGDGSVKASLAQNPSFNLGSGSAITPNTATPNTETPDTGANGGSVSFSGGERAKVLNGSEQPESGSPQMVRLEIITTSGTLASCSGVVIAPGKVLTAGHCATIAKQITVFTQGAAYAASQSVIAPGYFESAELNAVFNDAAVISVPGLAAPALPIIASTPVSIDSALLVFGFGLDESGGSGVLKFGQTKAMIVTPNHVFGETFNGGNVDPCFGDSGGPLVATIAMSDGGIATGIVGVVSSGTESVSNGDTSVCSKGDVTLYTNLQNDGLLAFLKAYAPGVVIL